MAGDIFTVDSDNNAAVRTVSVNPGVSETNSPVIFTTDENGNAAVRVVGSGGGSDVHNLGWFATPTALRTAYATAENGDFAIVGSTDTVWVWDEDSTDWVDSGAKPATTYSPFPVGWTTNSTTKAFCDDVAADSSAIKGMAYLGEVTFSDLPASMANAEVVVEIMDGTTAADKVIVLTCTSGNQAPYMWKYTYWNNGSNVSGWIGFTQTTVTFRTWGANE